jgi:tetratricopeptide (TPR) repeat protein
MKRGFADWEIWFKKSFVLYCKEKQFAEAVQVISTHANRLYQQGKFKAALNLYRKGLVLPSPEREKELLRYRIETVRIDTGPPTDKFARKIELLKKRCQFCTAQRDIGELMVTLNGLGNEYFNSGKYKTAYRAYQKAMKLARKIGHRQWIAYTSAHIGSCYWVQGRFEEARTYYQLDLDIAKELGDRQAIGVASGMVGGIYMDLGYPEKYLEYLWVQLRISDELQIRFDQCFARQQIGYVYRLLGEYEKSLQWLDESIQIAREIKNSSQLCYSLYYKGLTLCQLRDFVKAWQCSSEASRLSQSIGNQDIFNLRMQLMVWVTAVKTGRLLPGVVEDYMLALLPEQRELKFRAEIYCELYFLTAEFRYQKSAEKLILRILKKQPGDSEYQELLARVRTLKTED